MEENNKQNVSQIKLTLTESLIPIFLLIFLLSFNVYVYGDDAMSGSNQFILLIGGFVGIFLGKIKGLSFSVMINKISDNLKSVTGAIIILLFVGALSGTWLISGIIPSMIYYGLKILHPSIFLPSCLIICAIISIATGSSWTTSATVGIALIGISKAIGIPIEMAAGAIISGGKGGAEDKIKKMEECGITVAKSPSIIGKTLYNKLSN